MPALGEDRHLDLEAEQRHLRHAYECLALMEERAARATADAAERAPGDWDATVAHRLLSRRLATLSRDARPLCFGRIDEETGASWHIGRRHVEDSDGGEVVIDWRAPVAVPFYRATYLDSLGLRLRRRFLLEGETLEDIVDEHFDDPDASSLVGATGLPDPLLAELGRARTGQMRDIVSTIAAEQDRVIRAPLDQPLVVQGGPGTGKTAVGLHRAAFLLYEHRERLERDGVLVVGPNPLFLAYISEVLPSLGEVAVTQTTLAGLASAWRAVATEHEAAAALKGGAVMAEVLARAAEGVCRPPVADHTTRTRWGSFTLTRDDVASHLEAARRSGGTISQRRSRFVQMVTNDVKVRASERAGEHLERGAVSRELASDRQFSAMLQRAWPAESPASLVRRLLSSERSLSNAVGELLGSAEYRLLARRPARSLASEAWTPADLALLDEARAIISGVPRRYGHVVVDEAQDLSPMALRMVARRSLNGRSVTVLGDLAQATEPGACASWRDCLDALGDPPGAEIEELTNGYRVPRSIMELANALLADVAPGLRPTASVRAGGEAPRALRVSRKALGRTVAALAGELAARHDSVAVVVVGEQAEDVTASLGAAGVPIVPSQHASAPGCVAVLHPALAKGLEFDAVVVVEPSAVMATTSRGAGHLYVAMTRAVTELVLVHSDELPPALERQLGEQS